MARPLGLLHYPATLAHYVDSTVDNAYMGANCTAANCNTNGWSFAGWAANTGVRSSLAEALNSGSPLGYDSAVACQALCDAEAGCDYWYSEYELGKFECYLKAGFTDATCHDFSYKDDHYS